MSTKLYQHIKWLIQTKLNLKVPKAPPQKITFAIGEASNPDVAVLVLSGDKTYKHYQDRKDSSLPTSISSNQKPNKQIKNDFFIQWDKQEL